MNMMESCMKQMKKGLIRVENAQTGINRETN